MRSLWARLVKGETAYLSKGDLGGGSPSWLAREAWGTWRFHEARLPSSAACDLSSNGRPHRPVRPECIQPLDDGGRGIGQRILLVDGSDGDFIVRLKISKPAR